jgi:hypothetical protein
VEDTKDPLFPQNLIDVQFSQSDLLEKWSKCAIGSNVQNLKNLVSNSFKSYPEGLTTYFGRDVINFDIIRDTFTLDKYPSFSVHCENFNCSASCNGCDGLAWNNAGVLSGNGYTLDVSCCDKTCLIYIENIDGHNGAEIFYLREDKNFRNIDLLTLANLRNSNTCIKKQATESGLNISKLSSFLDSINSNSNNYEIDLRYAGALNMNINIDGSNVSIADYFSNTLLKADYPFNLGCELGKCVLECPTCDKKEYEIQKNSVLMATSDGKGRSTSKSSGSSSKSSSSSSKSPSSSSSSSSSKSPSSSSSSSSSKSPSSSSSSSSSNSPSSSSSSSSSKSPSSSSLTNGYSSSSTKSPSGSSLTAGYSSSSSKSPSGSSLTTGYSKPSSIGYTSGSYSLSSTSTTTNMNYTPNYNKSYKSPTSSQPITIKIKNYYNFTPTNYTYSPYGYYSRSYRGVYGYGYFYRPYNTYNTDTYTNYSQETYDPLYWLPDISKNYIESDLTNIFNANSNNLKIYISCCDLFCATYIDTINDITKSSDKTPIYLDFFMKNYAYIEGENLTLDQKQCFVQNFFASNNSAPGGSLLQLKKNKLKNITKSDDNIFNVCDIPSVYDMLPIKKNCALNVTNQCNNSNFLNLFNRVKKNENKCISYTTCLSMSSISSDDDKNSCGDKISILFVDNGINLDVKSVHSPCLEKDQGLSMIQLRQNNNDYIDLNGLLASELKMYQDAKVNAANYSTNQLVIDGSTQDRVSADTIVSGLAGSFNKITALFALVIIIIL